MNLQQTIRRILREESKSDRGKIFLLRRVPWHVIEDNFNICLWKAERVYIEKKDKWKTYTLQKYKDFVIGMMLDELYYKITHDFYYDLDSKTLGEIYDYLKDVFSEQLHNSYMELTQ